MSIQAQYQTGAYTRQVAALSAQSMVEIRFSDEDAGEVVAVEPQISLNSCEISSGRVNYTGRLIATLVYVDGEGKLCRVQKGAEFSHYIDNDILAPAQKSECALTCEKSKIKRDGSSLVLSVVAGAKIDVFDNAQRSFITSIDGAICKTDSAKLYSLVNFSGESDVDDDFDCVAEDVLVPSACVQVLDCTARAVVI